MSFKSNIRKLARFTKTYQKHKSKKILGQYSDKIRTIYYSNNSNLMVQKMLDNINISIDPDSRFQHWIDTGLYVSHCWSIIGNIPPYYQLVVDNSLEELNKLKITDPELFKVNNNTFIAVKNYIERILKEISVAPQNENIKNAYRCFNNMISRPAETLEDALQRILFWSSLLWQYGHKLVGLGRLDIVLEKFSRDYDRRKRIEIIKDFLVELHSYYDFKSNQLKGDIGQIIILGGIDKNGNYYCNNLTYDFITAIQELHIPDPKLLLRVDQRMPEELLASALKCIQTGVGSPLLSCDNTIIPCLMEFGYEEDDAFNYVTSACWEPVSYGNSLEQNNIADINFAYVTYKTLQNDRIVSCKTFDDFLTVFFDELDCHVDIILKKISLIKWEAAPLYTFLSKDLPFKKDIAEGGAKYNNYGLLSIGMSNCIDSLLNINDLVFQKKEWSLGNIHKAWKDDNEKNIVEYNRYLKDRIKYFGHDGNQCIQLTNKIMSHLNKKISQYSNCFGGKVKYGLSSPNYVEKGKCAGATFDGRNDNTPTGVHISSNDSVAYTELISFASQINYTGVCCNGNVIDFFVSPGLIQNNFNKFLLFIKQCIKNGFFEMQLNVVESKTLIDALANPERYNDLIVRVWGFSAFFNDLPDDYKQVLIKRAIAAENM